MSTDEDYKVVSSLTTPSDRVLAERKVVNGKELIRSTLDPLAKDLSRKQTERATDVVLTTEFVHKFPCREKRFHDPSIDLQRFGLISFIPARGAVPNEQGIYGFAKLRGNYATEVESKIAAQQIIQKVDSYHKIHTVHVGRPFPITKYDVFQAAELDEVQLDKKLAEEFNADVKSKREKEAKDMLEIEERKKNLVKEVEKEATDPLEIYTMLRTKFAQLKWEYLSYGKAVEKMRNSLIKTSSEIKEYDAKTDEYKKKYYEHYMRARAHIPQDNNGDNFIKFMVDDVKLDFLGETPSAADEEKVDFRPARDFASRIIARLRAEDTKRVQEGNTWTDEDKKVINSLADKLNGWIAETLSIASARTLPDLNLSNSLFTVSCELEKLLTPTD